MGFLDKVKNLFIDETEEEPIKSEMIQVEIPAPTKAEPEDEQVSDSVILKEESKTTPVFFDDEYFKELEKPKEATVKSSYLKEQKPKEDKKVFRPTPIISPVYGVLDKNYSKEDIKPKKEKISYTNKVVTIDEVRKKAYGTLEDELETTLFGNNSILLKDIKEEPIDLFDDIETKEPDLLETLKEPENSIEEINIVEEEMSKPKKESIPESELFDLIDSMYEKGE